MKEIVCVLIAIAICVRLAAQAQELEQLRLDLEKLSQFKMILSEIKSGYQTLLNGYNAVRDADKDNFNLHKQYFDGLLEVSATVKNDPAVKRIYDNQYRMVGEYKVLAERYKSSGLFTAKELTDMEKSFESLLDVCGSDLDMLIAVIRPGTLRMSDADRLNILQTIDQSIAKQLEKFRAQRVELDKQYVLRLQQKRDNEALKRLANIH